MTEPESQDRGRRLISLLAAAHTPGMLANFAIWVFMSVYVGLVGSGLIAGGLSLSFDSGWVFFVTAQFLISVLVLLYPRYVRWHYRRKERAHVRAVRRVGRMRRCWIYLVTARRVLRVVPGTNFDLMLYCVWASALAVLLGLVLAAFVAIPLGPMGTFITGSVMGAVVFIGLYAPYARWRKRRYDQWRERLRARGVTYL